MIMRVGAETLLKNPTKARRYCTRMTCVLLEVRDFDALNRRYQTEATLAEGREVMMLTSGAWKT